MSGRVATSLDEVGAAPSVVTIGFFDGVHRGHRAIAAHAIEAARTAGVRSVGVTFDRHPREIVRPGTQPQLLMTRERRIATLLEQGLDVVLVLPFTVELSRVSPRAFVEQVLVEGLRAVRVVTGASFRFGHGARGDAAMLAEVGAAAGFTVDPIALVDTDGEPISSTRIRELVAAGDVAAAARLLGRPHALEGIVVAGEGRGRTIGVPTANVEVDPQLQFPASGVYAARVEGAAVDDGAALPAAVNVGTRPTFGGEQVTVEAHVLDRDLDLYGRSLTVWFHHRLRAERKFDGPDALVAQIRHDLDDARQRLATG